MVDEKKVGLALGSGGARGFCHIGVLDVLLKNNIPIDYISGCSMGALIAACYACGVTIEQMTEAAISLRQRTVMDVGRDKRGYNNNSGFIRGRKAMKVVNKLLGDKTFEETLIPLRITAVNLSTGKLVVYSSGSILQAVRASISIPALFKAPYDEDNNLLVDGGIIERIPINSVRELGSDVVIAVDALGEPSDGFEPKGLSTIASVIERAYLLLDWEGTREKLKQADLVITPEQGKRSIFVFKENDYSINQGKLAAEEALPQICELLKIQPQHAI